MNYSTKAFLTDAVLAATLALVVTQAFGQGITIDLGKTQTGRYMSLVGNTAGSDGEIIGNILIDSEYAARNKGTSMYFNLADDFFYRLSAGKVLVNVEYYDAPGVEIKLVYDASTDHAGKEHAQTILTTGSNKWKAKSFTIDDACFGNGLAHGADLALVAAAGTMTINAVSVAPFEAFYNYGSTTDSLSMQWRGNGGGDSHTQIVTKEGEECVGTIGVSQYLYMDVADPFLWGGKPTTNVFVTVEYYDADPALGFRLQYDAVETPFKSTPYVYGRGLNSFRTCTFELSDAFFWNRQSPITDFRLHIPTPGLAINRILVYRLPKKPLLITTTVAGFTAYKALESPVMDGNLAEWGWLTPSAIVPAFGGDGSRTDEFYRTWLLDPANVPIVEPGETGVSDPGVPGNWDSRDLSGGVGTLWDDQNLYFSVNVKDNVVNASGADWHSKDGFGFLIDVSHTSSATNVPVPIKDNATFQQGEHFFFFPADQSQPGIWRHNTSQTGEPMPAGIKKTVIKTDSGYTIEASVPLNLIADDLTWHPGVTGDKDAFDPLFAWMINDNDGVSTSSGRVMCGGHSEDDEFWGTLKMDRIPLVDQGIMLDPGSKNYESFMKQVETQTGADGVTIPVERAGMTGVMLSSGCFYVDVTDSIWNAVPHSHTLVSIGYFDSASVGARFNLQYESDSTTYQSMPYVNITNTNKWKTAIFELKNARFQSHQNGHADFRFHNTSKDVVIDQIKVAIADLWIDLGDTTVSHGITETNLSGDGMRFPATVGGVNCKRNDLGNIIPARNFYHAVADSLIYNGNHKKLFLTVEYFDTTSSGGIGMSYDGMATQWAVPPSNNAYIMGTRQWKLHTFYLPDARFQNRAPGMTDFRITGLGSGPTFINRILIGSLDEIATSVDSKQAEPLTFRLDQNYPNPFNPTTTISFSLPSKSFVSLKIFDVLGREAATLVSEEFPSGTYTRQWNATGISSGVYFYRLQAGTYGETRRLVVVK